MSVSEAELKDAVKAALAELLVEKPPVIRKIIEELIEDVAMSRAIDEGMPTPSVSRDQVLAVLDQK
jgi:hypothetical protein